MDLYFGKGFRFNKLRISFVLGGGGGEIIYLLMTNNTRVKCLPWNEIIFIDFIDSMIDY